jgi:hypothetical protein
VGLIVAARARRGGGDPFAGAILRLKLDEGSGQTLADSSGSGRGFVLGPTSAVEAGADPSWHATGLSWPTASKYATQASGTALPSNQPLTLMFVLNPTNTGDYRAVFASGPSANAIYVRLDGSGLVDFLSGGTRVFAGAFGTSFVTAGSWATLAITFDFSSAGSTALKIYLNGVLDKSVSGTLVSAPTNGMAFLGNFANAVYYRGLMAEAVVFQAIKTQEQITELHAWYKTNLASRGISLP